jgi:hypothetical protein
MDLTNYIALFQNALDTYQKAVLETVICENDIDEAVKLHHTASDISNHRQRHSILEREEKRVADELRESLNRLILSTRDSVKKGYLARERAEVQELIRSLEERIQTSENARDIKMYTATLRTAQAQKERLSLLIDQISNNELLSLYAGIVSADHDDATS